MKRRLAFKQQAQWSLDDGINVVLFAGLGGACQGLEDAGLPIHVANNHDDVALAAHAALHPHTRHVRGDIFDVDPLVATLNRPVKVLWASPDCRDHSVAKGGAPRSARVRSLPWQVCRWAGKTRPKIIMMENVREIRGWGPLIAKRCKLTGRVLKLSGEVAAPGERVPVREQMLVRDKKRMGRSYRRFVQHIEQLGYKFEARDLCCADYGVPTTRRRWFAVARRDGVAIRWPARTHAPRDQAAGLNLLPWVGAHTIIDWSIPLPSIFERKKPLAPATCRRIAVGMKRYVLDNPKPFLITITHQGGDRVHDLAEPLKTITTAHRGEVAFVAPTIVRPGHTGPNYDFMRGQPVDEPLQTLTSSPEFSVTGAFMHPLYGKKAGELGRGKSPAEPLDTLTASPRHQVVAASLTKFNENSIGQTLDEPIDTLMAGAPRFGLVGANMVQMGYGERAGQAPRTLDVEDPLGTIVAGGGKHALVGSFMAQHNTGIIGHSPAEPLSTLTTRGTQQNVVGAYLTGCGGRAGQSAPTGSDEPMRTLTTKADQVLCASYLAQLRGTSDAADATEPVPTLTAGGNHIGAVAAFMTKYYGAGDNACDVTEPFDTLTTHDRYSVVTCDIAGQPYAVADIGMRMLRPHEGAAAHELKIPKEIRLTVEKTVAGQTVLMEVVRPLNATEITHLVGNSVPKRLPRLLAECNAVPFLYGTAQQQEMSAE